MFPEWINVLTMCAEKDKDKRNIWIAADNGQCIYQKRKFDEGSINLNFQGRGVIFNRIYRSGLYPWLFAACCHPKSLRATSHVGHINEIEFLKLADGPKKIQKNSYKLQAEELKFYINKMNAKGKINWGDVTLFYAVKGMNDHLPYDETVYNVLNEVFKECGDGGVEWLSFDHEKTNYKKNRVRACTFTSSQGLDSKTSVLFGAENFQLFSDDSWVDPDALFYTVLTRAVDNIILTYQNLESVDDRYKIMLKNGLLRFNHLKN